MISGTDIPVVSTGAASTAITAVVAGIDEDLDISKGGRRRMKRGDSR
jgi:hypothetical protein